MSDKCPNWAGLSEVFCVLFPFSAMNFKQGMKNCDTVIESEHISFEERLEELVVLNLDKEKIRVERVNNNNLIATRNCRENCKLTILNSTL